MDNLAGKVFTQEAGRFNLIQIGVGFASATGATVLREGRNGARNACSKS